MSCEKYKIFAYVLLLLAPSSSVTAQSQFVEYNELKESIIYTLDCKFENQEKECIKNYTFHNAGNQIQARGEYMYATFYWNHKFDIQQLDRHYCISKLIDDYSFLGYNLISMSTDSTLLTFKNDAFCLEPIYMEVYFPDNIDEFIELVIIDAFSEQKIEKYIDNKTATISSIYIPPKEQKIRSRKNSFLTTGYKHYYLYTGQEQKSDFIKKLAFQTTSKLVWKKIKADKHCKSSDPEDCIVWCLSPEPGDPIELQIVTDTSKIKEFAITPLEVPTCIY
jgi:hypothetical protein